MQVELPEQLLMELRQLVDGGWFPSEGEAVRAAVAEFIRRHQAALVERFQREDINWALSRPTGDARDRRKP